MDERTKVGVACGWFVFPPLGKFSPEASMVRYEVYGHLQCATRAQLYT